MIMINNGIGVIFKDGDNEVWYFKEGNAIRQSSATFNGAEYTYDGLRWKRDKRGKLSKVFVEWVDSVHNEAYKLYYGIEG
ncbi:MULTISPECIES: hypothetical protein [Bacillus cereus group]|uniref:hypothetical protein n=1 Tax=Bacillus cereus group TaxID=86661 RepID=UPI0011A8840B|nr:MULTISPECIES: hypothetical protein [Bacillus cereus group]MDF9638803.1 hypothetical protein [Bacillus cereus]